MDNYKLSISVDEVAKILGFGSNLMLELVKIEGFPAIKFKRKIIINRSKLQEWFNENADTYGNY